MALTDKLSAIADAIRGKTGKTEEMTLDQMATEIAGITGGGGDGLPYDMGEFVLDADTVTGANIKVSHSLGAVPEFICVWTDHWAGLSSDNPVTYADAKATAVGFVWLKEITGMIYRASGANSGTPLTVSLQILDTDYRVGAVSPNSGVYGMVDNRYYSETTFSPPFFGAAGARYRAGVTYKYFVSKAWWNIGGVADA